eukprot:COSAG02_NODE_116_length_35392_cov_302.150001_15_plen_173_part_00
MYTKLFIDEYSDYRARVQERSLGHSTWVLYGAEDSHGWESLQSSSAGFREPTATKRAYSAARMVHWSPSLIIKSSAQSAAGPTTERAYKNAAWVTQPGYCTVQRILMAGKVSNLHLHDRQSGTVNRSTLNRSTGYAVIYRVCPRRCVHMPCGRSIRSILLRVRGGIRHTMHQ